MRISFALLLCLTTAWGQKRFLAETDLYRLQWVAAPQISPDGRQVLFTKVKVSEKKDNYETSLWIVESSGGEPRQLTAGPRDTSAQWSPDGKRIAFLRSGQIHILSMAGGEARALTKMPLPVGNPNWSPDGTKISFSSKAYPAELNKKDAKPEEKSDVRVITKAVYRSNGGGYNDVGRPNHIWVVDANLDAGADPKQITKGEFSEADAEWTPDGKAIYFTTRRVKEPYYELARTEVYRVDLASGEETKITEVSGNSQAMKLSPDGKNLVFIASNPTGPDGKPLSYSQPDLYICKAEAGAQPRNLTASYDFDVSGGLSGDMAPPRGGGTSEAVFSADGKSVYLVATEQGKQNMKRVDLTSGAVASVTNAEHALFAFSATPDAKTFAVAISTPTNVGDLFLLDPTSGKLTQRLTNINEALWKEVQLTEPAMIWTKSFDGKMIQSWVQRPPDFQEGKKYPTILNIHGGPHAAYGYVFDHEFQWMAAKGYIVIYPNPRGSTSYGQQFGNSIQHNYPGDDHKDLMAAVDDVLAKGWADPNALGVTGGSGGGVLTNWAIGQTDRFKAAVSQRSIADWTSFWYTADFWLSHPTWFRAAPWEDEADFKRRSPISLIAKVKTPLMLIEGADDLRTPPTAGGEQMFRALKYRKIPTVMVQFPGETHELSRSGKPTHRVERLQHIVEWFEIYLKGKKSDAYDVK